MKLKKLTLRKYKRFHDLTIDLGEEPKRMVAFVGPNGCGKSSVFDALLYHACAYGDYIGNSGHKDYKYHSLEQKPSYNYKAINIKFVEGSYEDVHKKKQKEGLAKTIFSFRSSFRYNANLRIKESKAVSELTNNDFGASVSSDIDQRMEQNYRRLNIKYNKFLNDKDCRPSEAKEYIIGELNDAIANCLDMTIDNLGNIESDEGTLYFIKKDTEVPFEYNLLSAGEKEVVDILLDLYLRKDEYVASVYIIDEPELHLNTAIQRKLLVEINKMIPENCQILIATHSIGFLRALQDEFNDISQIIEFKAENDWSSKAYVLQPMVKSRYNWQQLFYTALDDLTGLIAPKRIVYCEGRAEPKIGGVERGLDAIVYNNIFNEKYPETLFVSSGGNTELDQRSAIAIAILTKVFNDVEILVLKDMDMMSGKIPTDEDRKNYLANNPSNHRVLNRFEIENYLYDKEVLKKYCQQENLSFNEEEYDNLVSDIRQQQVKDRTGKIKSICGIDKNLNGEKFKKNLSTIISSDMEIYPELEEVVFAQV